MCSNICFIFTINRGKLENCEKNIRSTAIFEVRFLENMFCLIGKILGIVSKSTIIVE